MNRIKNINEKIFLHKRTSESVRLGVILAIVGGFLDAYTYILYNGVFANAQTGNIVLVGIALANKNIDKAIYTITPIIACVCGIVLSEIIKSKSDIFTNTWQKIVILIELFALIIVGIGAGEFPERIVIVLISFVSSLQIQSFRKLVDSAYCTTMCTGNLRVASEAAFLAIKNRDFDQAKKAIRLLTIILFFISGAVIGGIASNELKKRAIWIVVALLLIAIIIFQIDKYRFKNE